MITKKQFCKHIINEFIRDYELSSFELNDGYILQSSSLAVAMEYLNLIKDKKMKEYASNRGGTFISYMDFDNKEFGILSTRELLNLLPEEI